MKVFIRAVVALLVLSGVATWAADYVYRPVTVLFEHDVPPDIKGYSFCCTDDNSGIVFVDYFPEMMTGNNTLTVHIVSIKMTAGKARCKVQAEDMAGQTSKWSDWSDWKDFAPNMPVVIDIDEGNTSHVVFK